MNIGTYLNSRTVIAIGTALVLSPHLRRTVRKGTTSLGSAAIKAGTTVARGTRNLQEAQKHVVRFGTEATHDASDL